MTDPHWERGYRCHGYWYGGERIGFVGLPPRGMRKMVLGYGWEFEINDECGRSISLRDAKREVEKAFRMWREQVGDKAEQIILDRAAAWR